ncbi:MAG: PorP/SprF family type IX secretion system membrane protein, partial [Chitinophagales bacterium]
LYAQTQPLYSQYHLNQLAFNPAYAGSKNALETNFFLHRQTVKIKGAPSTEAFTIHAPVANDKVGLGLKVYHDKYGVTNTTYIGLDYAYRVHINSNLNASFGLEASLANYSINYDELDAFIDGDPAFTGTSDSYFSPNFGAGFYLNSDKFYFGMSSISLLGVNDVTSTAADSAYDETFEQTKHFYATAGAMLDVGENFSVKPDILFKSVNFTPAQIDINLSLIFYNSLLVGAGYRTNKSYTLVAEYMIEIENTLFSHEAGLGYSFNSMTGFESSFLGPSHEIFLIYRFNKHNTNIKNPRFF